MRDLREYLKENLKGLYCITSEEHSLNRKNIEVVESMLQAGVKIIQYREKTKYMKEKYYECLEIKNLVKKHKGIFIVNDNIDLAVAVKADGVHIGQDDLPVGVVRDIVGNNTIIGLSTQSKSQANNAFDSEADYIGVGPIFTTYTKKDVCDAVGFDYLDYVVKNIDMPFVAIGGIKMENIGSVVEHGAKCIAMITEIVGASDITEICRKVIEIIWQIENKKFIKRKI